MLILPDQEVVSKVGGSHESLMLGHLVLTEMSGFRLSSKSTSRHRPETRVGSVRGRSPDRSFDESFADW